MYIYLLPTLLLINMPCINKIVEYILEIMVDDMVFTGYFIYDFTEIVKSGKLKSSWELLLHHIVVS